MSLNKKRYASVDFSFFNLLCSAVNERKQLFMCNLESKFRHSDIPHKQLLTPLPGHRGMPRALLKLAKRSLPMIRLRDFELLVNNLIVLFV